MDKKVIILGGNNTGKHGLFSCIQNQVLIHSTCSSKDSADNSIRFESCAGFVPNTAPKIELCAYVAEQEYNDVEMATKLVENNYFENAVAAMVVYDVTNPASLDSAKVWIDHFVSEEALKSQTQKLTVLLVGNKKDKEAQVTKDQVDALISSYAPKASMLNMLSVETSCNTLENVAKAAELVAKDIEQNYFPKATPEEWMDIKLENSDIDAFETITSFTNVENPPPADSFPPNYELPLSHMSSPDLTDNSVTTTASMDEMMKPMIKLPPPPPVLSKSTTRLPPPVPAHLKKKDEEASSDTPPQQVVNMPPRTVLPQPPAKTATPVMGLGAKNDPVTFELIDGDYACCVAVLKPQQSVVAPNTSLILYMSTELNVAAVAESKTKVGGMLTDLLDEFVDPLRNEAILNAVERTLKLRKVFYKQFTNKTFSQTKEICFYQPKLIGKLQTVDMSQHLGGLYIREGHILCSSSDILFIPESRQIGVKIAEKNANLERASGSGTVVLQGHGAIIKRRLIDSTSEFIMSPSALIAFDPSLTMKFDLFMNKIKITGPGTVYIQTRPGKVDQQSEHLAEAQAAAVNVDIQDNLDFKGEQAPADVVMLQQE